MQDASANEKFSFPRRFFERHIYTGEKRDAAMEVPFNLREEFHISRTEGRKAYAAALAFQTFMSLIYRYSPRLYHSSAGWKFLPDAFCEREPID